MDASDETAPQAVLEFTVAEDDTAARVGSGSLPVLGTPRLLAWCEAATCAAADPLLQPGESTVGVRVALDHVAATRVGREIRVAADLVARDGRRLTFAVSAVHADDGSTAATGEVHRVVVDDARFLQRV